MLGKLLKYDLKSMSKSLLPVYALTIFMGLFSRFTSFLSGKFSFLKTVYAMILFIFVVLIFACLTYTFIVIIQRFYNNLIKDEGYLIHTLPVKKCTIINAKLISSGIYGIICVVAVATALLARFYTIGCLKPIFDVIRMSISQVGYNEYALLLYVVIAIITGYFTNILMIYLSICLGQTENSNKMMYSFVYGIAVYMVTQVISGVIMFIAMLANKGMMEELDKGLPSINVLYGFLGISAIIMVIFPIIYYVLSIKLLDKKLNLE